MRLIDANALKQHYNVPDAECTFSYCDTIMRVIDGQPTIEAEPVRRGHWMFLEQKSGYLWKCSNCKWNFEQRFSYCPYCGAKMGGGADNG